MIRQIDSLRDFGIYRDFRWNGLPPFTKRNMLYGWNYSGKTTLSRLFQILEKSERLANWAGASFSISLEGGSTVTQSTLAAAPKVRVFNRDFIKESFLEEHTAPAVFILGPENVALRQRLDALNGRLEEVRLYEETRRAEAQRAQREIEQLATDKARDFRHWLGTPTFERPDLMSRVKEVCQNWASHLLTDEDAASRYETFRNTSGWESLAQIQSQVPDLVSHSSKVQSILSQTASNRAIERLKADRNLEGWVRSGIALHPQGGECAFCGSPIRAERLEGLRGHFSEAYEALVREVSTARQECQGLHFELPPRDERDFAPALRSEFNRLKAAFQNWGAVWADSLRNEIIEALSRKQTAIEIELSWQPDLARSAEGQTIVRQLNGLIQQHNNLAAEHRETRLQAKVALERHHAALFFRDNDLAGKEARRSYLENRAEKAGRARVRIDGHVTDVNRQLQAQSIGAVRLNDELRFLLRDSNIEVVDLGNGRFEFRRDGSPASNMSEGEKAAITFAYFLTSLEASGATLTDTIIFIDDPISSLDSNHIYAVYALIVERLKECRQIFVSTHSSELLGLLKGEWFDVRQQYRNTDDSSAYYVQRMLGADSRWTATLEDLPAILRKYKSEYQFVFSQLYVFANKPAVTLHEAYTAPNLVRKFLEAYLGFRKPSVSKWSDKLDLLFDSPEERREIQKFADDASHLQSLTRALEQPDFIPSAQRYVRSVINALQAKDYTHYQSLCDVIGAVP